ncbi:hypothetical protein FRB97_006194 [Tulasnella sp. 331]|nr:hypothetical protein FRB97_006194 [Tulasnella sp. 331]
MSDNVYGRTLPDPLRGEVAEVAGKLSHLAIAPDITTPRLDPLSPIATLPTENMVEIFVLAVRRSFQDYYMILQTLMHVCSAWRNIIRDSPRLWSFIFNRHSWRTIKTALANSGDYPLEINCFTSDGEIAALDNESSADEPEQGNEALSSSERRENRFLQEMLRHLPRWRYVWLGSSSLDKCAALATLNSAPLLERFALALSHGAFSRTPPTNLFGGEAPPRLKQLELRRVTIPWDSKVLSNLTSLSLHGILQGGPTVTETLKILQRCPKLQRFEMNLVERAGEKASTAEPTVLHLDHLTDLIMLSTSRLMTTTILSSLQAQACSHIEITIQRAQLLIEKLTEFILPSLQRVTEHPDAHIHVQSTLIEMIIEVTIGSDPTPAFHLRVIGGGSVAILQSNSLQHIFSARPVTLSFKRGSGPDMGGSGADSIAHAKEVLRALNAVERIEFKSSLTDVVLPILEQLSIEELEFMDGSLPGHRNGYPNFQYIEFAGCKGYAPSDILDFVQRRKDMKGHGCDSGINVIVSNGSAMDEKTMGQMTEALAGRGSVKWIREG